MYKHGNFALKKWVENKHVPRYIEGRKCNEFCFEKGNESSYIKGYTPNRTHLMIYKAVCTCTTLISIYIINSTAQTCSKFHRTEKNHTGFMRFRLAFTDII